MTPERSLQILNLPNEITSRWLEQLREPHRHYHTLAHIEYMLANMIPADATPELLAAVWLHDIVYDPRATNNEELSAKQAATDLAGTRFNVPMIVNLILGTKHHLPHSDTQNVLNDLDLLILGDTPAEYDRYAWRVRLEYQHVPHRDFNLNRALFMRHFLEQPRIYQSLPYQKREYQARANISREIRELEETA